MPRPPTRFDDLAEERHLGGLSGRLLGRGPRTVLLHGGPGLDHHLLVPLALELEGELEVVLPDLPGHGGSRSPGRARLDLEDIVDETADFLRRLDPAPAVLVGHSLGAHLALRLVGDGAVRPQALVLLAPPGAEPGGSGDRLRRERHDRRQLRGALLALLRDESRGPLAATAVEAVERSDLQSPVVHAALLGQLRRELARKTPRMRRGPPALIVTGDRDGIATPAAAESLAASLPLCRVIVLPDRGHWCVVTEPAETASAVLGFLRDRSITPRG